MSSWQSLPSKSSENNTESVDNIEPSLTPRTTLLEEFIDAEPGPVALDSLISLVLVEFFRSSSCFAVSKGDVYSVGTFDLPLRSCRILGRLFLDSDFRFARISSLEIRTPSLI